MRIVSAPLPSPPPPTSTELLLATALETARLGAQVHAHYLASTAQPVVREKAGGDFVSQVDLEAEAVMVDHIRRRFPEDWIVAEEGGSTLPDQPLAGRRIWVVDPLDGTTNFLHGHPDFAASVGVVLDGAPVVGAVAAAATREEWWGGRGLGAFRSHRRIRVSSVASLNEALVGTGFPVRRPETLPSFLGGLERVLRHSSGVRRNGSAALDLCYLAQGSLDAFWEGFLSPWDWAGGLAILEAAGGVWGTIPGEPFDLLAGGSLLAANSPTLQAELRKQIAPPGVEFSAPPGPGGA